MTKDEKQLLIKDLCTRLPYGVKVTYNISGNHFGTISKICDYETNYGTFKVEDGYNVGAYSIKPYLRPMSSMTEEELKELRQEHAKDMKMFADCLAKSAEGDNSERGKVITHYAADWCNKNHFDYRGLIPIGLALEAPEDMYSHAD